MVIALTYSLEKSVFNDKKSEMEISVLREVILNILWTYEQRILT